MSDSTHEQPKHGWTCFHCGETFTTVGSARDHFGIGEFRNPGCVIKVELGGERGLLMALRKAENEIARHMEEDSDIYRHAIKLQSKHSEALKDAEEAGYARGLRDSGYTDEIQFLQAENERLKQETKPFPMLAGIPITQTTAELIFEMYSALYGNDQSLEKIKSRGGFGWAEVKHITDNFIKRFGRQRYELLIKDK